MTIIDPRRRRPVFGAVTALVVVAAVFTQLAVGAAAGGKLKPIMAQPDKVMLHDEFSQDKAVAKGGPYLAGQGTQWVVKDGVLRGTPSTPAYQASKKDHKGLEPRVTVAASEEYIAELSFRFTGGKPTAIVPFLEFGHHSGRLAWAGGGAKLVADGESVLLAEAPEFKIESGKWYHALIEVKGDEIVIQFEDGPTIYGRHASLGAQKTRPGVGVTGAIGGTAEVDNLTIWSVKPAVQPTWEKTRATLPVPTAKVIKAKKEK